MIKNIVLPEFDRAFAEVKEYPPPGHGKLPERGIYFCDGEYDEIQVQSESICVEEFVKIFVHVYKHASGCTGMFQENNVEKIHLTMKALIKNKPSPLFLNQIFWSKYERSINSFCMENNTPKKN